MHITAPSVCIRLRTRRRADKRPEDRTTRHTPHARLFNSFRVSACTPLYVHRAVLDKCMGRADSERRRLSIMTGRARRAGRDKRRATLGGGAELVGRSVLYVGGTQWGWGVVYCITELDISARFCATRLHKRRCEEALIYVHT